MKKKKRGRKPKGGKIFSSSIDSAKVKEEIQKNIVLHLKCKMSDISKHSFSISNMKYDPCVHEIQSFNFKKNSSFDKLPKKKETSPVVQKKMSSVINDKLKELETKMHFNSIKKSSFCFWCTCGFTNSPVYIPSKYFNENIEVYGHFCSPECAVGFLIKENLDSSTRWERYALLNNIYGQIFNYTECIKPAPNPFYTLDKYYGNLSISEYRHFLSFENILLVINKPITKVLPELHKENFQSYPNFTSLHSKEKFFKKKKLLF